METKAPIFVENKFSMWNIWLYFISKSEIIFYFLPVSINICVFIMQSKDCFRFDVWFRKANSDLDLNTHMATQFNIYAWLKTHNHARQHSFCKMKPKLISMYALSLAVKYLLAFKTSLREIPWGVSQPKFKFRRPHMPVYARHVPTYTTKVQKKSALTLV